MKTVKTMIALLGIIISGCIPEIFAQEPAQYREMLENGKQWVNLNYCRMAEAGDIQTVIISVDGDDMIDGIPCKRITYSGSPYYSYAREENGIIYGYMYNPDKDCKEFIPVINFNLKAGDQLSASDGRHVTSVDYITIMDVVTGEDVQLKRINIGSAENPLYWVEGVGINNDRALMGPLEYPTNGMTSYTIACFSPQVFMQDFNFADFNLPGVSGVDEITAETGSHGSKEIYDLNGKKVSEPTAGNIYIKSGRKIMPVK